MILPFVLELCSSIYETECLSFGGLQPVGHRLYGTVHCEHLGVDVVQGGLDLPKG